MKIEIEIPDDELKEMLTKVISERLYDDYSCDRNLYKRTIAECVRGVIYKDKEAFRRRERRHCDSSCNHRHFV